MLRDYFRYCAAYHKINTKTDGLQPFRLRKYQSKWVEFIQGIKGPKRVIVLKPRQAGFSTLVSSFLTHKMMTQKLFRGIMLADQHSRTEEVMGIYQTFVKNVPKEIQPMISKMNTEVIQFQNPGKAGHPGLNSGVKVGTALDRNAGRAGTRKFAHLTESAFYQYAAEIDEGIQNSIPLHEDTYIIKESTANGRVGYGKHFYDLWYSAKRGESAYLPFFVAWHEVDDYSIAPPNDFRPTPYELDLLSRVDGITEANLMWRRLKIMEYSGDEESLITPEERFKQDFPVTDDEAFLSTGQPVFEPEMLNEVLSVLNKFRPNEVQDKITNLPTILQQFKKGLKIFLPPRDKRAYYIGADVAEGLAQGDASSAYVMDHEYNQVARWHGRIDPDMFGHLLIALGEMYNDALLIPENNNMGHTTITTIKHAGYPKLYKSITEDKIHVKNLPNTAGPLLRSQKTIC